MPSEDEDFKYFDEMKLMSKAFEVADKYELVELREWY